LAEKKRDEILNDAKKQADKISHSAQDKAKILESELEKSFVD
jgi:vacuolar-type H+-ATPase subunit H